MMAVTGERDLEGLFTTLQVMNKKTIKVPLSTLLKIADDNTPYGIEFNHMFTVVESFDEPAGKYPSTLGEVLLVDCNSANNIIGHSISRLFN